MIWKICCLQNTMWDVVRSQRVEGKLAVHSGIDISQPLR